MAATTYFATEEQLRQRASVAGILAAADDDADGVETTEEIANAVTEVRNYSRARIQTHLQSAGIPQPLTQDDSSFTAWQAVAGIRRPSPSSKPSTKPCATSLPWPPASSAFPA
jgi:hypothetical protein